MHKLKRNKILSLKNVILSQKIARLIYKKQTLYANLFQIGLKVTALYEYTG